MMNQHILIVEDEASIRESLALNLELEGYQVTLADDAQKAIDLFQSQRFDLILLDIMLPGLSGLDLCAHFRLTDRTVPIMLLTARDTPEDRIIGLRTGADDYLTKPFSTRELVARVRAVLRRVRGGVQSPNLIQAGELEIDLKGHRALRDGEPIHLTRIEFELLTTLAQHAGQTLSREQLLERIHGDAGVAGYDRSIDAHIRNLRRKIETDPTDPRIIQTVYGVGYRFSDGG